MADFARSSRDLCLGLVLPEKGTFRDAYNTNRQRANRDPIEDDPVATAICELVDAEQPKWTGTTGELLGVLSGIMGEKAAKSRN